MGIRKIKSVNKLKRPWVAECYINNKLHHLGGFETEELAQAEYDDTVNRNLQQTRVDRKKNINPIQSSKASI